MKVEKMKPEEVKSSHKALISGSSRISARKRKQLWVQNEPIQTAVSAKHNVSKKQAGKHETSKVVKVESPTTNVKPRDTTTSRPTPEECYFVTEALSQLHPHIVEENNKRRKALLIGKKQLHQSKKKCKQTMDTPVTDAIIGTMLSQNTTDANCHKAFVTLKKDFPRGWEQVANVQDITLIENSIKVAGLAKTRAQRIQGMLQSIQQERKEANFEYLQYYESNEEIVKELSRFKGMGPKTISCVLLFALGRNDFPVDTHVLRITQQMGWVGKSSSREKAYEYFKTMIPEDCMMDLHCLLVQHGKVCFNCASNGRPQFPPKVRQDKWICPLVGIKSGKTGVGGFGKSRLNEGSIHLNSENRAEAGVKMEVTSSLRLEDKLGIRQIKAEDTISSVKVKLEHNDSSSNLENDVADRQINVVETTPGIAVKVELM